MEHFQTQFFVSMLTIACCACAALICDFLINDQLRELIVKVKVRRPEAQSHKRRSITTPETIRPEIVKPRIVKPQIVKPQIVKKDRKRTANADALAAIKLGEALAGRKIPTGKVAAQLPEGFQDRSV